MEGQTNMDENASLNRMADQLRDNAIKNVTSCGDDPYAQSSTLRLMAEGHRRAAVKIDTSADDIDPSQPVIEEGDIPGILGTRDGMAFAYGILWATWGDKNTAAYMARHLLLADMTKAEQSKGIEWANKVLGLSTFDQVPLDGVRQ